MVEREVLDDFLQGRIGRWGVFHRLRDLGISAAAALAVVVALPNVIAARDTAEIREIAQAFPDDAAAVDRMLDHLAKVLEKVAEGGSDRPLETSLARLVANNTDLLNHPATNGNLPLNLQGTNLNLSGALRVGDSNNNEVVNLLLEGNVGAIPLNLQGTIELPAVQRGLPAVQIGRNINLGNVNLNIVGNAGNIPINFVGNVGEGSGN